MEKPSASIQSGRDDAVRRKAAAIVSGLTVNVADVPVTLRASDHRRAAALAAATSELPTATGDGVCSIDVVARAPRLPDRAPDEHVVGYDVWQDGADLAARVAGGALTLRSDDRAATIGGDGPALDRWLHRWLRLVATHLLVPHERFVVHGAAVAIDRRAWLVLGPTGAGKSSVAYAASRAGWKVLADDLFVLRHPRGGAVEVAGVPRPVSVPREILDGERSAGPADWRDRVIAPVALEPSWCTVAGALLVAHGGSTIAVNADPADVVEQLVVGFAAGPNREWLRHFLPIAAATARIDPRRIGLADAVDRRVLEAGAALATLTG